MVHRAIMAIKDVDAMFSSLDPECYDILMKIPTFRSKLIDKWQRKTEVTTGAADNKSEPHAFNQNISEQVASYVKDQSRMVGQMQMWKLAVAVFGTVPVGENTAKGKGLLYLKRLSAYL